jgi:hypothetical protein
MTLAVCDWAAVCHREEARAETAAQREAQKQAKAQERTMARAERGVRIPPPILCAHALLCLTHCHWFSEVWDRIGCDFERRQRQAVRYEL